MDGLDVVAVRIEQEGRIIARMIFCPLAGRAIVRAAGRESGCVELVDHLAVGSLICEIPAVVGYYKKAAERPCNEEGWASARPQMERAVQLARAEATAR